MDIKGFTNKETYLVNKWFGGDFIDRLCTDKGHGVIPTRQEFADYMSAHVASSASASVQRDIGYADDAVNWLELAEHYEQCWIWGVLNYPDWQEEKYCGR